MKNIQELLCSRGISPDKRIKIIRFKDYDMFAYDKPLFLEYQAVQKGDIFKDVDFIISFVGADIASAIFVGVFEILGKTDTDGFCRYDLREVCGFDDLKQHQYNLHTWQQWLPMATDVVEL